ncbi:MAG: Calx-beta domain-containing protein [Acidimicrobiales bacterium]
MRQRTGMAVLAAVLVGGLSSAGASAGVALSDACVAANDPIYDGRYADSAIDGPGLLAGFDTGEVLTVHADDPAVSVIAMFVNSSRILVGQPPETVIEHLFVSEGPTSARWTAFADVPTAVPADWVVECTSSLIPVLSPYGFIAVEGPAGTTATGFLPVTLSAPSDDVVTVDWNTVDDRPAPEATSGSDFVAASGTLTFQPGQTEAFVPIEILGDGIVEPPLYGGEWGIVEFSNLVGATLDTDTFFGAGLFIIRDSPPSG